MNLFKKQRPSIQPEQLQQIKSWVQDCLDLAPDIAISISQLQCHEPDCPPLETVISVMFRPPQTFKVHRPASELTLEELQEALQKQSADPPEETVHQ